MPCPLLIFSQSDCLIQVIDTYSHIQWQTVQIQISWLLQKPSDLDLHCLQMQGISRRSRTRVKNDIYYIFPQFGHLNIRDIGIKEYFHPERHQLQMSTHNIYFCGEIWKIWNIFLWRNMKNMKFVTFVLISRFNFDSTEFTLNIGTT